MSPLRVAIVLVALVLATAAHRAASAQPIPITVKIHGTVEAPPSEDRPRATWRLRIDGEETTLFVTRLDVLAGSVTNGAVIRQLRLSRGLLIVQGRKPTLQTIRATPDGGDITIQGTMRWADIPATLLVSTATR